MKTILFICTGNYYRSRFCEEYFNHMVNDKPWRAVSKGINADNTNNVGPMSVFAMEGLKKRGVILDGELRYPQKLTIKDLENASLTIAVKEKEHKPMMTSKFPEWAERINYWDVSDVPHLLPAQALSRLERQVKTLISSL